jgi:hypothetical protein
MRAGVGLACVVLLAACASTTRYPVPGGPSFESDEVRFVAPTGWEMRQPNDLTNGPGRVVVYLATQPLRDACGIAESSCTAPLAGQLRTGGMLVVWATRICAAQFCNLPSAPLVAIGNRQGVTATTDAGCDGMPFTERSAYYVTVTPQRVDILLICARDPSDATRSAFLGFLDAIQWRIP